MSRKRNPVPAATVHRATVLILGTILAVLQCWRLMPPPFTPQLAATSLVLLMLFAVATLAARSRSLVVRRTGDGAAAMAGDGAAAMAGDGAAAMAQIAAALLLGPVAGGLLVIGMYLLSNVFVHLPALKSAVNAASLGLAALGSGVLYQVLLVVTVSLPAPLSQALAIAGAATAFCLLNMGTLTVVIAPVDGVGVHEFWREICHLFRPAWGLLFAGGVLAVLSTLVSPEPRFVIILLLLAPYALAVLIPERASPDRAAP